jgi:MFS family permease
MLKHVRDMTMVQPVRLPDFRRLFVGEGIAVFADQMLMVALTLLALRVAGPGFALGSVLAVASVPGALLMPWGGWVSDRFSPARVLFLSGVGRTLLALALAMIVFLGISTLYPLYALAVALGVLNALYYPASLSTVPVVLEDKTLLGAGNALVLGAQQASETAGPVLAASVVALFGLGTVFGVNALMFAAAAILFALVAGRSRRAAKAPSEARRSSEGASGQELRGSTDPARPPESSRGPVAGVVEGIRYAWRDPLLRTMLFALALLSFATSGPLRVGGAMLAETRLGGAEALGVLLSAFGAGSPRLRLGLAPGGRDRRGDGRRRGLPRCGAHGLAPGADEARNAWARDEPDDVRRGRRRSALVRADGRSERARPEGNVHRGGLPPHARRPARRGQPHGAELPVRHAGRA